MTIYEMILEEGRQQGIILGREKTLWKVTLQMLHFGYDAGTIQSLLQVDQKVINQANAHLQQQHENRFWF